MNSANTGSDAMKNEYDFSKAVKNPYARRLKRQVTIRLDVPTVDYFKAMARDVGLPYQNLINLFLRECAERKRKPVLKWG
jgi:uncharacterized protein (DUF4415 family)